MPRLVFGSPVAQRIRHQDVRDDEHFVNLHADTLDSSAARYRYLSQMRAKYRQWRAQPAYLRDLETGRRLRQIIHWLKVRLDDNA